jgi:hypothetical protein
MAGKLSAFTHPSWNCRFAGPASRPPEPSDTLRVLLVFELNIWSRFHSGSRASESVHPWPDKIFRLAAKTPPPRQAAFQTACDGRPSHKFTASFCKKIRVAVLRYGPRACANLMQLILPSGWDARALRMQLILPSGWDARALRMQWILPSGWDARALRTQLPFRLPLG